MSINMDFHGNPAKVDLKITSLISIKFDAFCC